jgi:hypothetical protein
MLSSYLAIVNGSLVYEAAEVGMHKLRPQILIPIQMQLFRAEGRLKVGQGASLYVASA